MNIKNIFKRYELKYLISTSTYLNLMNYMESYMSEDEYGKTLISNIYYDTSDFRLIRNSIEKPDYKEKLRLRCYGNVTSDSIAFIELKKKYDSVVYKRRVSMNINLAEIQLLNNFRTANSQIEKEINYFMNFYDSLALKMFIGYERQAYFDKSNENFRVTFDKNICYRGYDLDLKSGLYGTGILPANTVLMEIKTADSLPLWMTSFLTENKIYKTTFSKYGKAYENNLYKSGVAV